MPSKKKKKQLQTLSGMHDVLPADRPWLDLIDKKVRDIAQFYRFNMIETPILEDTDLFTRGVGQASEVVEKQMYTFKTKGGDLATLRPEGTAPVARAYMQHGMLNLPQPVRLYYTGPFFRHERPQKGRLRQFHQFGFEVFGEQDPVIDGQLIQIAYTIIRELGIKDIRVEVNSIGDSQCRPYFKKLLANYFRGKSAGLCADCKKRLRFNPLRILDCKQERCVQIRAQAPQIIDHLCQDCHSHFKGLLEVLDELEIPYELNPHLVRGLDYYTKTVFELFFVGQGKKEWKKEEDGTAREGEGSEREKEVQQAQVSDALGGGGRYDGLVKLIGGKDTPAAGFAAGIERITQLLKEKEVSLPKEQTPAVFVAQLGELAKKKALRILDEFRKARIPVAESVGRNSLKSQLHIADRLGARIAIILGQEEVLRNSAIVREMDSGSQETVALEKLVDEVKKRLKR